MKRNAPKGLKQTTGKEHVCCVLITCGLPGEDGSMQVEMTYEGDPTLAAFLIQGAQSYMDELEVVPSKISCSNKVYSITKSLSECDVALES